MIKLSSQESKRDYSDLSAIRKWATLAIKIDMHI